MILVHYLVHNVCYQCLKFKVDDCDSLKVIVKRKLIKGRNSNTKCSRVMVLVHCILDVFYLCMNSKVDKSDKNSK